MNYTNMKNMQSYKGRIFKYIDIEGAIKSLNNKTLLFQKPRALNDPFECYPGLLQISNPDKYIDNYISRRFPNWSYNKRRKEKPKMMVHFKKTGVEYVYSLERDQISIASFSKKNDIALMWSYYCDKHNGITIGYDIPYGLFPFEKSEYPAYLYEVDYMKEIQKIEIIPGEGEFMLKWITSKSFEWQHEKEVRLFHFSDFSKEDRQYIKYDPNIVKKITFGVNSTDDDVKKIINLIELEYRDNDIELTRMIIGEDLFTIKEIPFE